MAPADDGTALTRSSAGQADFAHALGRCTLPQSPRYQHTLTNRNCDRLEVPICGDDAVESVGAIAVGAPALRKVDPPRIAPQYIVRNQQTTSGDQRTHNREVIRVLALRRIEEHEIERSRTQLRRKSRQHVHRRPTTDLDRWRHTGGF